MKRISFLAIALSLFIMAGGPFIALQGIAWVSMIEQYSKTNSLISTLDKTFSGKYPCSLCKKIAQETQKKEKSAAILKIDKLLKIPFPLGMETAVFLSSKQFFYSKPICSNYKNICYDPPRPYP